MTNDFEKELDASTESDRQADQEMTSADKLMKHLKYQQFLITQCMDLCDELQNELLKAKKILK